MKRSLTVFVVCAAVSLGMGQGVIAGNVTITNDICEDAIILSVPSNSTFGFTTNATIDVVDECVVPITAPGVWYSVEGTGNLLIASTCNFFTYMEKFDTQISVYCGDCDDLICVDGSDDGDCKVSELATVEWCSEAGRTYFILVHGAGTSTGSFELEIFEGSACSDPPDCEPPPTGACCATDGTCTVTTEADCSGAWTEDGVCSPNPCEQPQPPEDSTGSCCASDGSCTVTTEADCSGTWTANGTCSPNLCTQPDQPSEEDLLCLILTLFFRVPLSACGLCPILTLAATFAGMVGMKHRLRRRRNRSMR